MDKRIHNSGTRGYNASRSTESIDKRDSIALKSNGSASSCKSRRLFARIEVVNEVINKVIN
jgi:hypothetical protein